MDGNIDVRNHFLFKKAQICIKEARLISIPLHPNRCCIYEEALAIKKFKRDYADIVDQKVQFLKNAKYPKNQGLNETNIIFRFHQNPTIIKMMEQWFDLIMRFSRRDQLSFNYVLFLSGYKMKPFSLRHEVRFNSKSFILTHGKNHRGIVEYN